MTLPFFDRKARQEYVLRVQRAREPEEISHKKKEADITADCTTRHMLHSTAYISALREVGIHHLRNLIRIAREELFGVIDRWGINLKDHDIKSIIDYLRKSFEETGNRLQEKLAMLEKQLGLPACPVQTFERQIEQAITTEAVVEVAIRISGLRQKRKALIKASWFGRIGKLVWMIIGVALGVLGFLLRQWLLTKSNSG